MVFGQIDDFEGGTTQNWAIGNMSSPFFPINIANGGPGGVGDGYLQLNSSGMGGSGGKLVSFNDVQWTGNYIVGGITGIRMQLNNLGANPVSMRLAFGSIGGSGFSSSISVDLSPGSGWTEAFFAIGESAFVRLVGTETFQQAFADIVEIRILSATAPALSGDLIAATVGVDLIGAIPEPSTAWLVAVGAAVLLLRLRTRSN